MTNPYFDVGNYTPMARITTARAEAIDAIITAIVAGFAMLPTPTQLQKSVTTFVAADTGAANAYVIAANFAPVSYTDGMEIVFRAAFLNTGASTVNVSGLGAIGIRDFAGNALGAGAILGGGIVIARFDATNNYFRIISPNVTNTGPISVTNYTVAGTANQITSSFAGTTYTLSLPAAVTMPGSLAVTTSLSVTTTLGVTGLATLNGGLTVPANANGVSLSTTNIAGLTATLTGTLAAGTQLVTGGKFQGSIATVNPLGSITGSNAIAYGSGNVVTAIQNNAAVTYTFTGWPASGSYGYLEIITALDATPHSVTFTGATWDSLQGAPTLIVSKELRVLLETNDGGVTIRATLLGQY